MKIDLHPDLEGFVREMADGTEYRDEAEVLAEALFLLWQRMAESASVQPAQATQPA